MRIVVLALVSLLSANQDVENIGADYTQVKATAKDPEHTPKLLAPRSVKAGEWFEVKISVGDDQVHPSLSNHHVRYISLLADGVEINRVYLHPTMAKPEVTFVIALPDSRTFDKDGNVRSRKDRVVTLRAAESPNHSSEWWTETKVKVRAKR